MCLFYIFQLIRELLQEAEPIEPLEPIEAEPIEPEPIEPLSGPVRELLSPVLPTAISLSSLPSTSSATTPSADILAGLPSRRSWTPCTCVCTCGSKPQDDPEKLISLESNASEQLNDSMLSILDESIVSDDNVMDSSFVCSDGDESSSEDEGGFDEAQELSALPELDASFIVSWSALKPLLHSCYYETGPHSICRAPAEISKVFQKGTCIIVSLMCLSGHCSTWRSQPLVRKMALGNLRLTCATIFSGATYSRLREIFEFARIAVLSKDTFYEIQKTIVQQVVHECWDQNNKLVIEKAKISGHCKFSGDCQCDTPGYNAKYGIYSAMNQATDEIAAFRVTHCIEAGNSNRMEKFGFIAVMAELKEKGVQVKQMTTDRHVQVRKHVTEQMPDINLQFDPWHVSKNIKSNLLKA